MLLLMLFTDVPFTSEVWVEVKLEDELLFPIRRAAIIPPRANNPSRPNSQGLQQDLVYLGTGAGREVLEIFESTDDFQLP